MNTKLIIGIVVALAVAGGGAVVALNQAPPGDSVQTATTTAEGPVSLKSLLALSIPQQCTFTDSTEAGETSGTVYVAGGKARGDFAAVAAGQTFHAHALVEGDTIHSWVDETGMGVKLTAEAEGEASSQSFDASKELEYSCVPWVPDSSKFELPANINFMDVSAQGSGRTDVNTGANACAACDAVPEAYRAQCRAAAGC